MSFGINCASCLGSLQSGSLHSGSLQSRPTDFGSGYPLTRLAEIYRTLSCTGCLGKYKTQCNTIYFSLLLHKFPQGPNKAPMPRKM